MPTTPLFPLPEGLEITSISEAAEGVIVRVTSARRTSCCPRCSPPSSPIHSYYRRKPRDLPCAGRPIRLFLSVRKFFCRNPDCPQKVFTERLPDFIAVSSRLASRLRSAVQEIGYATCGKGGERLSTKLSMSVSDATLRWSLDLVPLPTIGQVEVLGIDDWSSRCGKRFGSILVDLQTHKIIDLLPERGVESVVAWLEAHPEIEIVSRDRGGTYVDGATQGAPLATQVCDRWHLLKNLREAVETFLARKRIRLPGRASAAPPPEQGEPARGVSTQECPLTTYSATPASDQIGGVSRPAKPIRAFSKHMTFRLA